MKIEIIKGDNNAVTDFFSSPSNTPETDDQPIIYAVNDNGYQVLCVDLEFARKLERERDGAIRQLENLKASAIHTCHDQCQRPMCVLRRERDEAMRQIKELIYIASRAISLAEIDVENDKFGIVSELRYELKQIMQEGAK
jgi:hypothetical protein